MLELNTISAAQSYDQDAVSAVLAEMDGRIASLAAKSAGVMATNPARFSDYAEEFRQDALVTLLEYLPRWSGETADDFIAYLYGAMAAELKRKVTNERHTGADADAISVFKSMVTEAGGDLHLAEKLAQTVPPKGKRLSADRANAARLAWQGTVSIDKTSGDDDDTSILHTLAAPADEPQEVRPKVGRGAALEALAVLHRYSTNYHTLNALPTCVANVDMIEDTLTVPREAEARKHVLDAVAILRSYVSTATDAALADDLRDVSDERRDSRVVKIENVTTALGKLSPGQRNALHLTWGIDGAQEFGDGDGSDLAGFAEAMGTTEGSAKKTRSIAKVSFVKHYVPMVATSEDDAAEWRKAAADERAKGGRK
jgi:DNA-directed RNA polymerase specialized sigma24 family protein